MFRYRPNKEYSEEDFVGYELSEKDVQKLIKYLNDSNITVFEMVYNEEDNNWFLKKNGFELSGKIFRTQRIARRKSRRVARNCVPSVLLMYYRKEGFRYWHYYPED